jgi:hypothetical protein
MRFLNDHSSILPASCSISNDDTRLLQRTVRAFAEGEIGHRGVPGVPPLRDGKILTIGEGTDEIQQMSSPGRWSRDARFHEHGEFASRTSRRR